MRKAGVLSLTGSPKLVAFPRRGSLVYETPGPNGTISSTSKLYAKRWEGMRVRWALSQGRTSGTGTYFEWLSRGKERPWAPKTAPFSKLQP